MLGDERLHGAAGASTSAGLIDRAKRRDPEAWRQLLFQYSPLVFHWCHQHGLDPSDAADVVQEVFAAASAALERFEHRREGAKFRGWLRKVAQSKIADYYRRLGGQARAVGGTDAAHKLGQLPDSRVTSSVGSSGHPSWQASCQRALATVRSEFEEPTWQAFWQSVIKERATADIAADLGISANAVRQYKSRVLRRLREELGEEFP